MKRWFRQIAVAFAKQLLPLLREAQRQNLKPRFKSCGSDITLFYPLCVYGAESMVVGNNVSIGAFTHIWGNGGIQIGDRVMIASNTAITTLTHDYDAEVMQNTLVKKKIVIEDDAWIGAHSTILPGVTIGKGAVVGAGSVVTRDVEPYAIVMGVPARVTKYREIGETGE